LENYFKGKRRTFDPATSRQKGGGSRNEDEGNDARAVYEQSRCNEGGEGIIVTIGVGGRQRGGEQRKKRGTRGCVCRMS